MESIVLDIVLEQRDLSALQHYVSRSALANEITRSGRWTTRLLARNSTSLGSFRAQFDRAGMRSERDGQSGFIAWKRILRVDETVDHLFLRLDRSMAVILPKRHFGTLTPQTVLAQLHAWHSQGAAESAQPAASQIAETAVADVEAPPSWRDRQIGAVPQASFLRGLYANLRAGLRVAIFRRVQPSEFVTGLGQIVALLVIAAGVAILLDWLSAESEAQFDYSGFYSWAICMVVALWACALVTRTLSSRADSRTLIVVVLAVAPWFFIVISVFGRVPLTDSDPLFASVTAFFVFVFAVQAIRAAHGFLRLSTLAVVVAAAACIGFAMHQGYIYARFWQAPYEDSAEQDDPDTTAAESMLFDQAERIDEAMQDVKPGRPGVTDVFFVGFAGDGSQQVFRREALFGERVFASRMGSGTHSMEFINDETDRISHPLGTMTGLRYGLKRVASRMDPAQDVLVLFLTSHGSQEEGLYVHNGSLPLNSIEPEEIRRALDASGIKWRVIIVSACYAGTFIEPLQDDDTLIITAADAEHTSFGCAADRDLTYFGEAFLRDALPKAPSLEAAFEVAREDIARREQAEKLTPSRPQIFVGTEMRAKLAALGPLPVQRIAAPPGR
jgi:hypothetical protein